VKDKIKWHEKNNFKLQGSSLNLEIAVDKIIFCYGCFLPQIIHLRDNRQQGCTNIIVLAFKKNLKMSTRTLGYLLGHFSLLFNILWTKIESTKKRLLFAPMRESLIFQFFFFILKILLEVFAH